MASVTVLIPEELYNKMKKYSEVKWSEVVRKTLVEYIRRLEVSERGVLSSDELSAMLRAAELDVGSISLNRRSIGISTLL